METRKKSPGRRKSRARTQEVLGIAAQPARIDPRWRKHYQRLIELREYLTNRRAELNSDALSEQPSFGVHMADAGTDTYDRDFALGMISSEQDAIYEIEEALKRIEKKTYGICELTGKTIPKSRLEAIPWTRFTVDAQAQLERDGALRQRRIGALGTVDNGGATEVETDDDEQPEEAKASKEKE